MIEGKLYLKAILPWIPSILAHLELLFQLSSCVTIFWLSDLELAFIRLTITTGTEFRAEII